MRSDYLWRGALAVVFFIAGFVMFNVMHDSSPPEARSGEIKTVMVGDSLPDFKLPDLSGRLRSVDEWRGQVLAINFWASWCPPCLEEIPHFIDLQTEYREAGVQFLGLSSEDLETVRAFADTLAINYPLLVGAHQVIDLAVEFGNQHGALPYTVIVDRDGQIRFIKHGPISLSEAEQVIVGLL